MTDFPRLDDSAVVRRIASNMTHVAEVRSVRRGVMLGVGYWAPALTSLRAACGVEIPTTAAIMQTGTTVRCRACVHLTGITEQSPAVHEKLGALLPLS